MESNQPSTNSQTVNSNTGTATTNTPATPPATQVVQTPELNGPKPQTTISSTPPSNTPPVPKAGWWSRQSGFTKGLIIIGGLTLVTAPFWLPPLIKKGKKNKLRRQQNGPVPQTSNVPTNQPEAQPLKEYSPEMLPKGECSQVLQRFNRDYDFVKCDGKWYIKSKDNPGNAQSKPYPEWVIIDPQNPMIQMLNSKYPH